MKHEYPSSVLANTFFLQFLPKLAFFFFFKVRSYFWELITKFSGEVSQTCISTLGWL